MANQSNVTVVSEGYRNARVRVVGVLDSSDLSLTPAFTVATFTNNDPNFSKLLGFRLDRAEFSVAAPLTVVASWNAATPQLMVAVSDANDLEFCGGLQPVLTASGFDGSVNVVTEGYVPGSTVGFTLNLEMVKLYSNG